MQGGGCGDSCQCRSWAQALAAVASWELGSVWSFSGETRNPYFCLNFPNSNTSLVIFSNIPSQKEVGGQLPELLASHPGLGRLCGAWGPERWS